MCLDFVIMDPFGQGLLFDLGFDLCSVAVVQDLLSLFLCWRVFAEFLKGLDIGSPH